MSLVAPETIKKYPFLNIKNPYRKKKSDTHVCHRLEDVVMGYWELIHIITIVFIM